MRDLRISSTFQISEFTYCDNYLTIETDICQLITWMCTNVGQLDLPTCEAEFLKSRSAVEENCDGTPDQCLQVLIDWTTSNWAWWPATDAQWKEIDSQIVKDRGAKYWPTFMEVIKDHEPVVEQEKSAFHGIFGAQGTEPDETPDQAKAPEAAPAANTTTSAKPAQPQAT